MRRLETRVDVSATLELQNRVIFPLDMAGEILECLGVEEFNWSEHVLNEAQAQITNKRKQIDARIGVQEALLDPKQALSGYNLFHKLDEHQSQAVAAICVPTLRGLGLFDEQGTGKTIIALAAFDRLNQQGLVQKLLVIAPKSVLSSWVKDASTFLEKKYKTVIVSGIPRIRRKTIRDEHDILLINYEALVGEISFIEMVIKAKPNVYMLVVDESYFIKNPAAIRSRAINRIRPYCERAIVLSGTPAPNSPVDIVNQITAADGGIAFSGRARLEIRNKLNEAEEQIKDMLDNAIYLRRLKEEVFPNLPTKEFEKIFINLQPIQKEMYDQVRKELVIAVREIDDREFAKKLSSFLAKRIFLLQICSHPASIDPAYSEEPAKILALDQLVNEVVLQRKEKVVIWSYFRYSVNAICSRYKDYGVVKIDGSVTKIEDRISAIDRFQNDPHTMIFVGNAAAAGAGITLTAAHHAIYESFSNQAAHYMQSVDRIHRRGQTENVSCHILLCANTIEHNEFEKILAKQKAQHDLLGDHEKEIMTRERFLRDLGEEL